MSKFNKLMNGIIGDFCICCYILVGMVLDEFMVMSNMDCYLVVCEGVMCVVCYWIN